MDGCRRLAAAGVLRGSGPITHRLHSWRGHGGAQWRRHHRRRHAGQAGNPRAASRRVSGACVYLEVCRAQGRHDALRRNVRRIRCGDRRRRGGKAGRRSLLLHHHHLGRRADLSRAVALEHAVENGLRHRQPDRRHGGDESGRTEGQSRARGPDRCRSFPALSGGARRQCVWRESAPDARRLRRRMGRGNSCAGRTWRGRMGCADGDRQAPWHPPLRGRSPALAATGKGSHHHRPGHRRPDHAGRGGAGLGGEDGQALLRRAAQPAGHRQTTAPPATGRLHARRRAHGRDAEGVPPGDRGRRHRRPRHQRDVVAGLAALHRPGLRAAGHG